MRGIVFLGLSQYGVLDIFLEEMIKGFEENGHEIVRLDSKKDNIINELLRALSKPYDFAFDINAMLMDKDEYYQLITQKYITFLVDHPMYHHARLSRKGISYFVSTVDKEHTNYLKKNYPHLDNVRFIPHGGVKGTEEEEYENRNIPVLILGTYENPRSKLEELKRLPTGIRELIFDMCRQLESEPGLTMEQVLRKQLYKRQIIMEEHEYPPLMAELWFVDKYIRAYYRDKVIRTLAENNIPLEIYGNGWEHFDIHSDCVQIHKNVSYEESLNLMGRAKIVLNIMPWFKNGSHERVFTTMLNGALCVTDRSQYLEDTFTNEEDIVFYELDVLETLPEKIQTYLKDSKKAEKIALTGKDKAQIYHTWRNREQEILNWISDK